MNNANKIKTLALTLLITGSIDSIRNLPTAALFGSTLIFFFAFAAITFLIPSALVSAELASNLKKGGIYQWVRQAFGEHVGFLSIWLQWISNVIWFPTVLSFISGTTVYLIDPTLSQNKFFMAGITISAFWLLTIANLRGIRTSAKFASFCTITGLILPMTLIIGLLIMWLLTGKPLQIHLTSTSIFPNWMDKSSWTALMGIMLSFVGMELATVHINDVNNPQKTFPRALVLSSILILATMVLGSLAIAFILPANKINLVDGTIQAFSYFLSEFNLQWLTPILTILLIIGSLGGLISWVVSPVKGIAQAAENGFLPPVFVKENKHGVPQNLLITQAILVTLVCLTFVLLPSVNASYWLLSSLSTQLYIIMYAIMFLTARNLRKKLTYAPDTFKIPGGKIGLDIVCLLGLIGCAITLAVGFVPPSNINIGSNLQYLTIFSGGMVGMTLPVLFFFRYRAKAMQKALDAATDAALESA